MKDSNLRLCPTCDGNGVISQPNTEGEIMEAKDFLDSKLGSTEYIKSQYLTTRKELEKCLEDYAGRRVKLFAIPDVSGSMQQVIRDEMDADMEDSGMAQGEIESCLNHWNNKYVIQRKEWFGNNR